MSLDTLAGGDGTRVCRVAQSGWILPPSGALPTTPTWDTMRLDMFGLDSTPETKESKELNPDREYRGTYFTGINAGGRTKAGLIYGEHDSLILDALHSSGFSTNVANIGSAKRFWLFEETVELGSADQYKRFVNSQCDSAIFTFGSEDKVMMEHNWVCSDMRTATAAISGSTYPAQSYTRTPATVEGITGVTWTGLPVGLDPIIQELKITIEHGLNRRKVWNSLYTIPPRRGKARVTVEIKAYLDDRKLYDTVLARDTVGLTFDTGGSGAGYRFAFGRLEWMRIQTPDRESEADIMPTLTAQAAKSSSASSLKVTKL